VRQRGVRAGEEGERRGRGAGNAAWGGRGRDFLTV
jgi:hypothetical protein